MKNKIIALILSVACILSCVSVLAAAKTIQLGDVNADGKVTAIDARTALRAASKLETLEGDALVAADTNSDGKVTAIDARTILRAASKLEELPAIEFEDPSTEEPSSEEPTTEEPSTEEPSSEEPTTEPPAEEPDTGVVVTEYPEAIDAFFSGEFYLNCVVGEGADAAELKLATKGNNYEFSSYIEGKEVSFMVLRTVPHMKFTNNKGDKIYIKFDDATKDLMLSFGVDFDELFESDLLAGFTFTAIDEIGDPVLTKGEYNGAECDVYSFANSAEGSVVFKVVDGEVRCMSVVKNGSAASEIHVKELSGEIPSGMLSVRGYEKGGLADLMTIV